MKIKLIRIGATLLALSVSIVLILLITSLGRNSKGPLENLFVRTSDLIDEWDDKLITKRFTKTRAKSLNWFEPIRQNLDSLKISNRMLLGVFDNHTSESFQNIFDIESNINKQLPFIHIYSAWGSEPKHRFPLSQSNAIYSLGSIPVLTWEPWLNDFDKDLHPHLKDVEHRDHHGLKDVANGDYDFYLETFVEDVILYGKPILIRLGHEMNDPYRYTWGPQNNTHSEFIDAWQHVVDFFKNKKADNVIWIWSPHPAYGFFEEYYPGDEYVDWVGVGTLNYGSAAVWSKWWTLDDIYGNFYEELSSFNKPIMLTEFGSLAVGGDRAKWYEEALCELPNKYPNTKAILFFHYDNDVTLTNKSLNWDFVQDSTVTKAISGCIQEW